MRHINYDGPGCPVEACTEVIAGKWKGEILHLLLSGSKRHGELRRLIPNVTQRMLTNQLRELEAAGIVQRRVMDGMPLRSGIFADGERKGLGTRHQGGMAVGPNVPRKPCHALTSNRSLVPTDTFSVS